MFSIWPLHPGAALGRIRLPAPRLADGGVNAALPVRLALVMAHLGSYEEILAHVFHTSVPSSITLPGESLANTKHTPQQSGTPENRTPAPDSAKGAAGSHGVFVRRHARPVSDALMNVRGSRLGGAADSAGCGDCQPSTWDSWAACWAAGLTGRLLTAPDRSVSVPQRYLQPGPKGEPGNMCSCLSACH